MRAIIKGFHNEGTGHGVFGMMIAIDKAINSVIMKIAEFEKEIQHKKDNPTYSGTTNAWTRNSPQINDQQKLENLKNDLSELRKFKSIYMMSDQVRLEPEEVDRLCKYISF